MKLQPDAEGSPVGRLTDPNKMGDGIGNTRGYLEPAEPIEILEDFHPGHISHYLTHRQNVAQNMTTRSLPEAFQEEAEA